MTSPTATPKKKVTRDVAWREARELLWHHRKRLLLGTGLMLVNRAASFALPASSRLVIDKVIPSRDAHMLTLIAFAVGIAVVVQAVSSFGLSQILGVAAQKAITEMRRDVQEMDERVKAVSFLGRDTRMVGCTGDAQIVISNPELEKLIILSLIHIDAADE
jgi:subfamily B ATP-binding cassette protein MsbA